MKTKWTAPGVENVTAQTLAKLIMKTVCKCYAITESDLVSKSRKTAIVEPRQIYCYLVRRHLRKKITLMEIGATINRDHATVLYGERTIKGLLEFDKTMRGQVKAIENKVKLTKDAMKAEGGLTLADLCEMPLPQQKKLIHLL